LNQEENKNTKEFIQDRIKQLDEADRVEARANKLKQLSSIMPNLALIIHDDESAINDILYLNTIYVKPTRGIGNHLQPDSRINLRRRVMDFINEHNLSGDAVEDLVKFLKSRGAF